MKNLNKSGKSKGVLLFATNTDTVDYVAIANRAERLINHYLELPVTIIESSPKTKNKRYSIDTGQFEFWNNKGRGEAYDLSPYEQTLLLDSDYLIFDDNLLKILDSLQDYKIAKQNNFIDGTQILTMGKYSLPTLWATVIAFDKTKKSKLLFDLVKRIELNYTYYWRLYNISATNFRNDFAFTIADNIINGYTQDQQNYLPWPIITINKPIQRLSLHDQKFFLQVNDQGHVLPKQNLHIMSKEYLLSDGLDQLIKDAINA
jgi:hypothetical protein